jgi:hypothetical protein
MKLSGFGMMSVEILRFSVMYGREQKRLQKPCREVREVLQRRTAKAVE